MAETSAKPKNEFRVITPIARLCYPALFRPAKPMNDGDQAKYQCELVFPKGTNLSELLAVAQKVQKAKAASVKGKLYSPFRKGDEDRANNPEYEGAIFISPRSSDKPGIVVGPNREPVIDESEIYAGCWVRASVTAYFYDKPMRKGIAFALNNVWKIRDGEPLTSRISADRDFEGVEEDGFSAFDSGDQDTTDSLL